MRAKEIASVRGCMLFCVLLFFLHKTIYLSVLFFWSFSSLYGFVLSLSECVCLHRVELFKCTYIWTQSILAHSVCVPFFHAIHAIIKKVFLLLLFLHCLADSTVSSLIFFVVALLHLYLRVFRYYSLQNMAWRMRHIKRALVRVLYIAARTYLSECVRTVCCAVLCTLLSTSHAHTHWLGVIFIVKFFISRAYSCLLLLALAFACWFAIHIHKRMENWCKKFECEQQQQLKRACGKTAEERTGEEKNPREKKHSKAKAMRQQQQYQQKQREQ